MNDDLIAEIKAAYHTHKLVPVRGYFYLPDDLACPLMALALSYGIVNRNDPDICGADACAVVEWSAQHFGEQETRGFLDGFDRLPERTSDEAYLTAYTFGQRVAQEIVPVDA